MPTIWPRPTLTRPSSMQVSCQPWGPGSNSSMFSPQHTFLYSSATIWFQEVSPAFQAWHWTLSRAACQAPHPLPPSSSRFLLSGLPNPPPLWFPAHRVLWSLSCSPCPSGCFKLLHNLSLGLEMEKEWEVIYWFSQESNALTHKWQTVLIHHGSQCVRMVPKWLMSPWIVRLVS